MSASDHTTGAAPSGNWIANQPYLLLSITALCWAGNAIVGRLAAGHIPPVTLSFLRWSLAFLIILPFAWKHLVRDWDAIRGRLGTMVILSITGISAFNTMQYWALEHTQALNTLLLQSAAPLFVAIWSLLLLGIRLTLAQAGGLAVSLAGVLVILLQGDLTTLKNIEFNIGDIIFVAALADLRAVFDADLQAPADPRPVVRRLYLRLRRRRPDSPADLGTHDPAADAVRHRQPADAVLCRGVPLDGGLSVLQSRRAPDRRQPRGARSFTSSRCSAPRWPSSFSASSRSCSM